MADLHDATEEYLETILEIEEEGIPPIRARLVERLGLADLAAAAQVDRLVDRDLAQPGADGGASLEAVATMLQAIKDMESPAGVKVSGGVKTVGDGAQYIALVEGMMGKGWINTDTYRVGASGVLGDIAKTLGGGTAPAAPAPSGY